MTENSTKFTVFQKTKLFSTRQHICYSALYATARLSVRLSVCPSVTRVDQSKTVEVITKPSSHHDSFPGA